MYKQSSTSTKSGASIRTNNTMVLQEDDLVSHDGIDNPSYQSSDDEPTQYGTPIREPSKSSQPKTNINRKRQKKKNTQQSREVLSEIAMSEDDEANPEENVEEVKMWNVFREKVPESDLYGCDGCIEKGTKLIKLSFIFFGMVFVLIGSVISKLSLLYIANNANTKVGFHRTIFNTSEDPEYQFACPNGKACTDNKDDHCGVPLCLPEPEDRSRAAIRWIWALFLCLCAPYIKTFISCLLKIMLKTKRSPTLKAVIFVCTMETLHSVGMFLLLFAVLPYIDAYRGIFLMNGVFLIPAILIMALVPKRNNQYEKSTIAMILDGFNILLQLGGLGIWVATYILVDNSDLGCETNIHVPGPELTDDAFLGRLFPNNDLFSNIYLIPISLFMMSFVYWDNFVDASIGLGKLGEALYQMHKLVKLCRTKLYFIVASLKIVLSFVFLLVFWYVSSIVDQPKYMNFPDLFNSNGTQSAFINPYTGHVYMDWIFMAVIQIFSGFIVYWVVDVVVKARVQEVAFSVPVSLTTPCAFAFLCMVCFDCKNSGDNISFGDVYWNCFGGYELMPKLWSKTYFALGFVIWGSQLWLGRHIWKPESEKLAKTDRIFASPCYCGCLLEQSLIFNRRRNDQESTRTDINPLPSYPKRGVVPEERREDPDPLFNRINSDSDPFIFCCATMWHETEQEMINILKSIYRLDFDQSARRNAQDHFKIKDPDFYQFEAHVFFDDAFKSHTIGEREFSVNDFVTQLHRVMGKAAEAVHKVSIVVNDPEKFPTPYGGRIEYRLPGGNMLIVHMKDKQKIRHRKRWSQVMYMYYLLGYRLWSEDEKRGRKEVIAHNTFLLALDGDVDFKPEAVILLVDLMKRNAKVGAACGRIHPMGSGPMIWYQQFEYAVSHWLQKATEHVLGCVLCSPGCFSLFRGSAIMDDNVMKTYSKQPTEALDHVQYDQGEDRWLCTLLLQQGYRVEYAAASDAMTFAPESFNEFFNQRKRWTPSTFANILDLLKSGRATVKKNDNISMLYIVYQGVLFVSSIIGPGTIFLLITGALQDLLDQPQGICFIIVAIPITAFFILTFVAKPATQLLAALLLSGLMMAVMVVVIITVIIGIAEGGLCEPDSIFVIFVFGVFVLAAILHPQEGKTLIFLPLYFLMIPTMYVVLIIYAMTNMHDISWGTREVPKTEAEKMKDKVVADEFAAKDAANKKKSAPINSILSMFGFGSTETKGDKDGWTMSLGDCCSFMCCPRPGESLTDQKITKLSKDVDMLTKEMKRANNPRSVKFGLDDDDDQDDQVKRPRSSGLMQTGSVRVQDPKVMEQLKQETEQREAEEAAEKDVEIKRKVIEDEARDLRHPHWINDEGLGHGPRRQLGPGEISFWKGLIKEYLYPLEMSSEVKKKLAEDLKDLRNKTVAGFFVLDILLIVFIQSLYLFVNTETGEGPLIPYNCTDPLTGTNKEYFFEPIGLMFLSVFGAVTIIQMLGMFAHRWFSLLQIVSSTTLRQPRYKDSNVKISPKEAVNIAKDMQTINDLEDEVSYGDEVSEVALDIEEDDVDDDNVPNRLRQKSKYLTRGQTRRMTRREPVGPANVKTLDQAFARRFLKLKQELDSCNRGGPNSRDSDAYEYVAPDNEEGGSTMIGMGRKRTAGNRFQSLFRGRRSTVHQRAIQNLARDKDVFTEVHSEELRQRYDIKDDEIKRSRLSVGIRNSLRNSVLDEDRDDYENIEMTPAPAGGILRNNNQRL